MSKELYRYAFTEDACIQEVEASLVLAIFGTEALHGETQFRLDAAHAFDASLRTCVIDASTPVGRDLNRLFAGYLRREFGEGSFNVKRLQKPASDQLAEAAA